TPNCGRGLARDGGMSVAEMAPEKPNRRQAASHGPVFDARQRYVEDVVVPPTKTAIFSRFAQGLSMADLF
uniref:hypothetical protein n=1 Tax=Pseudomonas viridiflava TaxID=33069 RepID=UPI0019806699